MPTRATTGRTPRARTPDPATITIRDFGPISRGTIRLRPLTILTGPNNSGKSYAAMLACSLLSSINGPAGGAHGGALEESLASCFGIPVRDLVRSGRGHALVSLRGAFSASISDTVRTRRSPARRGAPGHAPPGIFHPRLPAAQDRAPRRGRLYDLAVQMESEILHGHIERAGSGIIYSTPQAAVPLHAASSAARALAPLLLYLKHAAAPGSLLVLEEPESGLHLAGRALAAKHVVRMVRAGLDVLLTTNSSAMIDQFSMYVQAGRLGGRKRTECGLGPGDMLHLEEVSPYLLGGSPESGYAIRRIRADAESGIPHADYVGELERLFNRAARIEHEAAA